jgi:hypothetical protein
VREAARGVARRPRRRVEQRRRLVTPLAAHALERGVAGAVEREAREAWAQTAAQIKARRHRLKALEVQRDQARRHGEERQHRHPRLPAAPDEAQLARGVTVCGKPPQGPFS